MYLQNYQFIYKYNYTMINLTYIKYMHNILVYKQE